MYRFLQKNNRKLLAIFTAFLMVVFILPSTANYFSGGRNYVVGRYGEDGEVRAQDLQHTMQEWKYINNIALPGLPSFQNISIGRAVLGAGADAIERDPDTYYLLLAEARRNGVTVDPDRLQELLTNRLKEAIPADREAADGFRRALENLLTVRAALDRAAAALKFSDPAVRHELAHRQQIRVSLIELPAEEFEAQAQSPTTQQAQEHFEKYKDVAPGATDPKRNPMGFGYRVPDRVKLQYLSVPRSAVQKAAEAARTPHEWEVVARKYYLQNQAMFPTTQPAHSDATPFSLDPTTGPTSRPTTRPFEEVREDVLRRIVEPETDKLTLAIQGAILSRMEADYSAYRRAAGEGTTRPSTAPASSLGVSYDSFDYFRKLAEHVQRQHGVLPAIVSRTDRFLTHTDLRSEPGIGMARASFGDFARYAIDMVEPLATPEVKQGAGVLSLLQPSQPLRDYDGGLHFFRVTEAQPAHPPASVGEVEEQVQRDLVRMQAYERAIEAAQLIYERARSEGLAGAAKAAGKTPILTGPFSKEVFGQVPGYVITGAGHASFLDGAFALLAADPSGPEQRPIGLAEIPQEAKVLVVELYEVLPPAQRPRQPFTFDGSDPGDSGPISLTQLRQHMEGKQRTEFAKDWFDPAKVRARLNYRPTEQRHDHSKEAPAKSQPRPSPIPG